MRNGRHEIVVLELEVSSDLRLIDFRGVTADRAHAVDREHIALSSYAVIRSDKDGNLEPALIVL
eukprot:2213102-Heterocapsa_arctica.AAC.1